jgi:predicted O-methyltransferase YrrM
MEHFYQSVPGFFDFEDLYSKMVREATNGARFVEIGCWKGKSAAYMAVEIVNSGKDIKFDCVDTWLGSYVLRFDPDIPRLYEVFLENINPVRHVINPVKMTSVDAAKTYSDNSLDFVFLDAEHDYHFVKPDILAWLPKVKIGGIFAGHDYFAPPGETTGVKYAVDELLDKSKLEFNGASFVYKK